MPAFEHYPLTAHSFKCVFNTYKRRLYGYIYAITRSDYAAEEITQEIFIKLWVNRDSMGDITNLDQYIFAMARNKTLNHLRKSANNDKLLADIQQLQPAVNNNVEERVLEIDYNQLVQKALTGLSPQRRLVYHMSRYKGLNTEEIASSLQLSPNTVKNHLGTALRFIRTYLGNHVIYLVILITGLLP